MKKIEEFEILKNEAYKYCGQFVSERIGRILSQIKELEIALSSETKSSAGDKHETGRAMIQLEREKLGRQLSELEKTQQLLSKVPKNRNSQLVGLGNLITTDSFTYYIAISAGEYKNSTNSVYCISAATPIGKLIYGKVIGDTFHFNGTTSTILTIH